MQWGKWICDYCTGSALECVALLHFLQMNIARGRLVVIFAKVLLALSEKCKKIISLLPKGLWFSIAHLLRRNWDILLPLYPIRVFFFRDTDKASNRLKKTEIKN